jgi:hypothetical protein
MSRSASLSGTGLGRQTSSLNAKSTDSSKSTSTRPLGNFHGTIVTLGSPWRFKPAGVHEVQRRFDAVLRETGTVSLSSLDGFSPTGQEIYEVIRLNRPLNLFIHSLVAYKLSSLARRFLANIFLKCSWAFWELKRVAQGS